MSYQMLKSDVLFYQRFLKANGFYKKELNGTWNIYTNQADADFILQSQSIAQQYGKFHPRSEENIITLVPKTQILARKFLTILTGAGKDVRIISGTRTYAEQDMLYRKGRFGNKERKVTNARGGQSNHNFGIAWDIGLFETGRYITIDSKYKQLSSMVLPQLNELEWGGAWVNFPDVPHYQHQAVSNSVAQVRNLFEIGNTYV
jgi:peptidoglycan L-alanyl-D-glutamate endopeptidase CwlK